MGPRDAAEVLSYAPHSIEQGDIVSTEEVVQGVTLFGVVCRVLDRNCLVRFSSTVERWVSGWQLQIEAKHHSRGLAY